MEISNCSYAEEIYDLVPLHILQSYYMVSSVGSIILVIHIIYNCLHRTIFEKITKELIIALCGFITIYSVCLILVLGAQLTYRYMAREKCDAQVPMIWCLFRWILTSFCCSFLVVHIGITAQHALSSFHFGVRIQKIVARLAIILAFVYSIVLGILAYSGESLDGRTPYCSGFTANSEGVLLADFPVLLVLDVLNTIVSLALWKYNQHKLVADRESFDLSLSFHRRQNLYAMRQFAPVAVLHTAIYSFFIGSVYAGLALGSRMSPGWSTFTNAAANVIPDYCLFCPLLLFVLIRRGRFERISQVQNMVHPEKNVKAIYFEALRDQWGK